MHANKPYSPSCERNKESILEILKLYIQDDQAKLLEVGSGAGQHAVYFSKFFPGLEWHCSDLLEKHSGIKMWLDDEKQDRLRSGLADNLCALYEYQVAKDIFPKSNFSYLFTANTFHIMSWEHVQVLIKDAGDNLVKGAFFIVYGPFNYDGNYSSKSNEEFDKWLQERDPQSAIRDFEDIKIAMIQAGFEFVRDHQMPANNRTLVLRKI